MIHGAEKQNCNSQHSRKKQKGKDKLNKSSESRLASVKVLLCFPYDGAEDLDEFQRFATKFLLDRLLGFDGL